MIKAAVSRQRAVHQADQERDRRLGEGHQDARHQGGLGSTMYNLHLSPEQLEFRDTVRDFVEDEVKPVTLKADRLDLGDRTLPVGGAAQGLADGASHAGAARGPGRRRRRCADLPASSPRSLPSATPTSPRCWPKPRRSALRLFAAMTRGAARALRPGVPRGRRLSSGAGLPRARRRQRARHQLPPPRRRRCALATTATRDGDHWIINGAKDCHRQRADRQADRGRGADRQGRRRCSWCRATRRASPSPSSPSRAGITAPAGSFR